MCQVHNCQVGIQVLEAEFVVRPHDGSLEQAPHALNGVGADIPAYPFLGPKVSGPQLEMDANAASGSDWVSWTVRSETRSVKE